MPGGVGRYTGNLVRVLQRFGGEISVACKVDGDFLVGTLNKENSDKLLRIDKELRPDHLLRKTNS
jgi:hypothetical protein